MSKDIAQIKQMLFSDVVQAIGRTYERAIQLAANSTFPDNPKAYFQKNLAESLILNWKITELHLPNLAELRSRFDAASQTKILKQGETGHGNGKPDPIQL